VHARYMSALQLRDVPEDIHRALRIRAAQAGQSLSEYALGVLRTHLSTPTITELADRISHRTAIEPGVDIADLIRAERDSRAS